MLQARFISSIFYRIFTLDNFRSLFARLHDVVFFVFSCYWDAIYVYMRNSDVQCIKAMKMLLLTVANAPM